MCTVPHCAQFHIISSHFTLWLLCDHSTHWHKRQLLSHLPKTLPCLSSKFTPWACKWYTIGKTESKNYLSTEQRSMAIRYIWFTLASASASASTSTVFSLLTHTKHIWIVEDALPIPLKAKHPMYISWGISHAGLFCCFVWGDRAEQ